MRISIAIAMVLLLNTVLPAMASPSEQDGEGLSAQHLYILRYALAKLIIRVIVILEAVLQENIGIALRIETQDAIEDCYALLRLLEVQIANRR